MVFCGKLSKACLPCRKRRLVCDLRKDGCTQCSRASLVCTGYRDIHAIRIEDQTKAVQERHNRRKHPPGSAIRSLNLSLCQQANAVFYQDHVLGDGKSYCFLKQYLSTAIRDAHLIASINAVSLAYLHYQKPCQTTQTEARLQYIEALKLASGALQNSKHAVRNPTMLSIMLLDLFEKISSTKPQYSLAWVAHIEGALSLVSLRGHEQYLHLDSIEMLERLSTNILISCVVSEIPVPDAAIALQAIVTPPYKKKETELMTEFAQLKDQTKRKLLTDDEISCAAMNLDVQFSALSQGMPSSWQPTIVSVSEKSKYHFEAYHYLYKDEQAARMWNVLSLTRILTCELILSHCRKSSASCLSNADMFRPEHYATTAIHQLSLAICATVPQVLIHQVDTERYLPCHRLIFPLYVAAQSPVAWKEIKEYAVQQLYFMAERYGIKNALIVARILESGERRNPWDVYALLGSYAFVC